MPPTTIVPQSCTGVTFYVELHHSPRADNDTDDRGDFGVDFYHYPVATGRYYHFALATTAG
jgi:hypothetical protein